MPVFQLRKAAFVVIRDGVWDALGSLMRWSLVFRWAKMKKMPLLHNVRSEHSDKSVDQKTFRQLRFLIPASGFHERKLRQYGKKKQSFYISARDNIVLSFAGIWISSINAKGDLIKLTVVP